jgi:hypothetical protein
MDRTAERFLKEEKREAGLGMCGLAADADGEALLVSLWSYMTRRVQPFRKSPECNVTVDNIADREYSSFKGMQICHPITYKSPET